ncbi:MAG: hypothetical protein ACRCX2_10180 [Paraclostridium sp.]
MKDEIVNRNDKDILKRRSDMKFGDNFYIFEVLEEYEDLTLKEENRHMALFKKGQRFIGFILEYNSGNSFAVKSNMDEIIQIPIDKVKKVFDIVFDEIDDLSEFRELKEILHEED